MFQSSMRGRSCQNIFRHSFDSRSARVFQYYDVLSAAPGFPISMLRDFH
jgi:hypothetical protein